MQCGAPAVFSAVGRWSRAAESFVLFRRGLRRVSLGAGAFRTVPSGGSTSTLAGRFKAGCRLSSSLECRGESELEWEQAESAGPVTGTASGCSPASEGIRTDSVGFAGITHPPGICMETKRPGGISSKPTNKGRYNLRGESVTQGLGPQTPTQA